MKYRLAQFHLFRFTHFLRIHFSVPQKSYSASWLKSILAHLRFPQYSNWPLDSFHSLQDFSHYARKVLGSFLSSLKPPQFRFTQLPGFLLKFRNPPNLAPLDYPVFLILPPSKSSRGRLGFLQSPQKPPALSFTSSIQAVGFLAPSHLSVALVLPQSSDPAPVIRFPHYQAAFSSRLSWLAIPRFPPNAPQNRLGFPMRSYSVPSDSLIGPEPG